ncbi:EpsG family protein [Vibrio jasicida]|uniref:EpsG family protein n=1 Tax=Vibrio jasicida TaxID=766224 RepID=UPI0003A1D57E|nr:EpsG family protein [Vibrio jasicida]
MAVNVLYPLICSVYVLFIYPIIYSKILNKNKILSLAFLLIPLFITTATQVNIGTDYPSYIGLYKGEFPFDASKGVIFNFLFDNLNLISNDPRLLFVTVSALQVLFQFLIYKKVIELYGKTTFLIFLIVYFCLTFTSSFNILRSSLASLVLAYSFLSHLPYGKIKKYTFSTLLAALFHPTAILFVFIPIFLPIIKRNIPTIILISIAVIGFILGQIKFVAVLADWLYHSLPPSTPYRFYLVSEHMNSYIGGLGLGMFVNLIFCLVGAYLVRHERRDDMILFYNLSIITYSLGMVFYYNPIFNRVLYYLVFFQAMFLSSLIVKLSRDRYLYSGFLVLVNSLLYFYFGYYSVQVFNGNI